jgi:hypothetical protein
LVLIMNDSSGSHTITGAKEATKSEVKTTGGRL